MMMAVFPRTMLETSVNPDVPVYYANVKYVWRPLRGQGVSGDSRIEGAEEALNYYKVEVTYDPECPVCNKGVKCQL